MNCMNSVTNTHSSNHLLHHPDLSVRILFLCTCIVLFCCGQALAVKNSKVAESTPSPGITTDHFEYQLENRPDPFVPFITEKAAASSVNMDEIVDKDVTLTGMQLFEPGQLTLVALLKTDDKEIAMVEDFTGKGYVLTKGTKIGRRGVVTNIASNTVIIEETAETRGHKKIVTQVVMILKKEGDK